MAREILSKRNFLDFESPDSAISRSPMTLMKSIVSLHQGPKVSKAKPLSEIGWYQDKYNKYSLKRKLVYKRTTQNCKRRRCEPQNPVTRNEVDADYGPAADLYMPTQIEKN
jgi:hypothetical protein